MNYRILLFLAFFILAGCVTDDPRLPGHLNESISVYDQASEVNITPAWTLDSNGLKLGLSWRAPMKDDVLLIADAFGAHNFEPNAPLKFKIDGKEEILKPLNEADYGEIYMVDFGSAGVLNQSKKYFYTNRVFIKRILEAKNVVVRAELHRGFLEGRFSLLEKDTKNLWGTPEKIYAYNAFSDFYKRVWGEEQP